MAMNPIEGQPGLFRDPDTQQIFNIRDFREGDKYDTVAIPATVLPISFGTELVFFLNIQNKRDLDTNLKTQRKLSAGESMVLDRIGLYPRSAVGDSVALPRDIKKIFEDSFFRLKVNDILQDEGPAIKFPSGYGLYGQTTETDAGVISVGVPATASASRLAKKQLLNQNHELDGVLRFDQRTWLGGANDGLGPVIGAGVATPVLEGNLLITCFLHGLIRSAVTK
jgi:hypothetical protein